MDYRLDIKAIFDSYNIEYSDRGKNVTRGWINIACPFCGDHSNHCGINTESQMFHCWICGEKGHVVKLLKRHDALSNVSIRTFRAKFSEDGGFPTLEDKNETVGRFRSENLPECVLPQGTLNELPAPHRNYLTKRGYDPDKLVTKFGLKAVYTTGKYRFRIVAPVILDNKIVSWVAADIVRNGAIPYLNCPPELSSIPINSCLYNIDSVKDTVIITEGITDVWRIGDGCVASFRKDMTTEQVDLLLDRGVSKVFVMYDSDAADQADRVANSIGTIIPTEMLTLDEGDPGDLTETEVADLRREIFL